MDIQKELLILTEDLVVLKIKESKIDYKNYTGYLPEGYYIRNRLGYWYFLSPLLGNMTRVRLAKQVKFLNSLI